MSYVYVIGPMTGPLKVGITQNLESRLAMIQTGHPERLSIIAQWPHKHPQMVEKAAHKLMIDYRLRGEWFNATREYAIAAVRQAIAEVEASRKPIYVAKQPAPVAAPAKDQWQQHDDDRAHIRHFQRVRQAQIDLINDMLGERMTRAQIEDMKACGLVPNAYDWPANVIANAPR